jgi:hypothetical protein
MTVISKRIAKLSCIACIIACIGDFAVMFFLGTFYPGYSQLKNTMSSLGASISPVSDEISAWWIMVGLLFIFFGIGFKQTFKENGRNATIASWLIILYGVGEGIGSGAFKADHIGNSLTIAARIHDTLGGIGVGAILILPLITKKVLSKNQFPYFYIMSSVVFYTGTVLLLLFSFRFSNNNNNILNVYQGLWQRLMMLNWYIYLTTIAFIMYRKISKQ